MLDLDDLETSCGEKDNWDVEVQSKELYQLIQIARKAQQLLDVLEEVDVRQTGYLPHELSKAVRALDDTITNAP